MNMSSLNITRIVHVDISKIKIQVHILGTKSLANNMKNDDLVKHQSNTISMLN